MRKQHEQRVKNFDHLERDWRKRNNRVGIQTLTKPVKKGYLIWSRKKKGFAPERIPAVWSALSMISGSEPKRIQTKKSVSNRKLKVGDVVACQVERNSKDTYARRDLLRCLPENQENFGQLKDSCPLEAKKGDRNRFENSRTWKRKGWMPHRMANYEAYSKLMKDDNGLRRTIRF